MQYNYAVLSFCSDLTNPQARSVPIGLIAIGYKGSEGVLVTALRSFLGEEAPIPESDNSAKSILENLQDFVHTELQDGLNSVGPKNLLDWLQGKPRNTIHVSFVGTSTVYADEADTWPEMAWDALSLFNRKILEPVAPSLKSVPPLFEMKPLPLPSSLAHPVA